MGDRLAILVIHGMGTQKPYETLDQFACGLEPLLNSTAQPASYARTLEFREHPSDPAKQQEHWTQAIVRFRSLEPEHPAKPELIDLVETPGQSVKLTKRGVEFKGSNTKQRKKLMHDLLLDLKIFRHLLDKIESSPEKQLTEE